jgi:probable rRNA maturation factor
MAGRRLTVVVSDERGRPVRVRGLASWLRRVAPARARGTLGVALVSDARIRALNRTYRREDYATDVLSFPAERESRPSQPASRANPESRPSRASGRPEPVERRIPNPGAYPFLGDVVIARGVARRQARRAGHGETTELRVLALHGLLHLLGYDHERDNGRMAREEMRLRRKGGLRDGLIERAAAARGSTSSPRAVRKRDRGSAGSPRAVRKRARPELVEGRAPR